MIPCSGLLSGELLDPAIHDVGNFLQRDFQVVRLDQRAIDAQVDTPVTLGARPAWAPVGDEAALAGAGLDDAVGLEGLVGVVKKPTDEEIETCKSLPIWQGEVSTFDWDYTQTETCLIIEGKVTVTDRPACEDSVTFGAGDMVVFPVGLACIWKIEEAVRKYYEFS